MNSQAIVIDPLKIISRLYQHHHEPKAWDQFYILLEYYVNYTGYHMMRIIVWIHRQQHWFHVKFLNYLDVDCVIEQSACQHYLLICIHRVKICSHFIRFWKIIFPNFLIVDDYTYSPLSIERLHHFAIHEALKPPIIRFLKIKMPTKKKKRCVYVSRKIRSFRISKSEIFLFDQRLGRLTEISRTSLASSLYIRLCLFLLKYEGTICPPIFPN